MQAPKLSANVCLRCVDEDAACCCASLAAACSVRFCPRRPAMPPATAPIAAPFPASPAIAPIATPAAVPFAAPLIVPPLGTSAAGAAAGAAAFGSMPVFFFAHAKHSFSSSCCCLVDCPSFGYTTTPAVLAEAFASNGGYTLAGFGAGVGAAATGLAAAGSIAAGL